MRVDCLGFRVEGVGFRAEYTLLIGLGFSVWLAKEKLGFRTLRGFRVRVQGLLGPLDG